MESLRLFEVDEEPEREENQEESAAADGPVRSWRFAAGLGAIIVTLIAIAVISDSGPRQVVDHTLPPDAWQSQVTHPAPESLGFRLDELADRWNEVDSPLQVGGALVRRPDRGALDAFTYQFGREAMISGAYDRSNDYIYALIASEQIGSGSRSTLAVHVCHVVAPFSPECLDAHASRGLGGETLEEYVGEEHQAEWTLGDLRFRVNISENVHVIRVFSPGA